MNQADGVNVPLQPQKDVVPAISACVREAKAKR
jgi:hypothetical protein